MPIVAAIQQDIKTAMLARDSATVDALKNVKSALQYAATPPSSEAVAKLSDEQVIAVMQKESKKRQESADMYAAAGADDRAAKELAEKALIDAYLPPLLTEDEVRRLLDAEIAKIGEVNQKHMGQLIGAVKAAAKGQADGSLVARLVREHIV